jgi:hypothetical protein
MCCERTLYNLQGVYVNRIIYAFWLRMQEKFISELRARDEPICISGDGQYDSPGHNAARCFYRYVKLFGSPYYCCFLFPAQLLLLASLLKLASKLWQAFLLLLASFKFGEFY